LSFSDFDVDPALLRGISEMGFVEPTPIQIAALPPALAGSDILASAMTGSGKTAAFVLPILQRLLKPESRADTRALILTPTRELAAQVHDHLVVLGRHTQITATTVFGGVKPTAQVRALRSGVDVVVATPGRLLDHMSQPWFRIDRLEVLVLDEADRMLDMGFLPDVRRILARLPERRQTMLFSATMPRPIVELSRNLLVRPVRLDIERRSAPATGVRQAVLPVAERDKKKLLLEMLHHGDVDTALVFTRTKHRANRLAKFLDSAGIRCDRIHGNRSQPQREAALAAFKMGRIQVLVATDIAARGIDVEALPHVINFDVPRQPEDYIHRVGRTARANTTGDALTFVAPDEERELQAIERVVGRRLERHQRANGEHSQGYALRPSVARGPSTRQWPDAPQRRVTNVTNWPTIGVGPEPGGPAARSSTVTGARRISGHPEKKRMSMSKKLFVGSLSWNTNDHGLREAFAQHGEITEAKVITDRDSGRSRGFGFVTFADDEAAEKAIAALNQSELDGRTIKVDVAQDRDRDRDRGRHSHSSW
jgi:ATP-dependent RNA helicase RhlE